MNDHWNVLYQVSVFYNDRKSKMATTAGHTDLFTTNCLTSCLHLSLITGSDFFKLSPLLAFGMPPLIFSHILLDHQRVCKEHGYTIIIDYDADLFTTTILA
jgi:hypothetical protein